MIRACVILLSASAALAQPQDNDSAAPPRGAEGAVELYLTDRGFDELLEVHLRQRLDDAPPAERAEIAERLSEIYARRLETVTDPAARDEIEQHARDLLARVDASEARLLRLALELANFRRLEAVAERHRVRLTDPIEADDAARELSRTRSVFSAIANEARRQVETFEREEKRARTEERSQQVDELLTKARALKSRATYFAAWSSYYMSVLTEDKRAASEALTGFGEILGAEPGEPADLERYPKQLLNLDHIARSCIGTAACHAILDERTRAQGWIDQLNNAEDLPQGVRDQLFAWKIIILSEPPGAWSAIDRIIRDHFEEKGPDALSTREARLLAVLALEQSTAESSSLQYERLIAQAAEIAFGVLAERGEIAQLIDLMDRYPRAPIPGAGFIGAYVEGVNLMDEADVIRDASGQTEAGPAESAEARDRYRDAARAFANAADSPDADAYPAEVPRCYMRLGFSRFGANQPILAADAFESALASTDDNTLKEEALWNAIISLERAKRDARTNAAQAISNRIDKLAALYLASYPTGDRAVRLLIQRAGTDDMSVREAIELLLTTDRESPLRPAAERRAAELLYRLFRQAPDRERPIIAIQFLDVAEQATSKLIEQLRSGELESNESTATRTILLLRQIAGVALDATAPDPQRAARALEQIERVAVFTGADTTDIRPELTYRALQIDILSGEPESVIEQGLQQLRASGGPFAAAADVFMYRRALEMWRAADDLDTASASLIRHGDVLIRRWQADGLTLDDPSLAGVYSTLIDACEHRWNEAADAESLALGLTLAKRLNEAGDRDIAALTRLARLAEASEDPATALDAWRLVLSGSPQGTNDWYEARVQTIRLLAISEPARARAALDQHKALEPDLAPEPWRSQLIDLDKTIPRESSGP